MKEAIKSRGERAEHDQYIHEELAQTVVDMAWTENYLNENQEWEAAEEMHEMVEDILQHSPDTVRQRAVELKAEKED